MQDFSSCQNEYLHLSLRETEARTSALTTTAQRRPASVYFISFTGLLSGNM
jgi:hypothetical protein